jgi:hypothetical protein
MRPQTYRDTRSRWLWRRRRSRCNPRKDKIVPCKTFGTALRPLASDRSSRDLCRSLASIHDIILYRGISLTWIQQHLAPASLVFASHTEGHSHVITGSIKLSNCHWNRARIDDLIRILDTLHAVLFPLSIRVAIKLHSTVLSIQCQRVLATRGIEVHKLPELTAILRMHRDCHATGEIQTLSTDTKFIANTYCVTGDYLRGISCTDFHKPETLWAPSNICAALHSILSNRHAIQTIVGCVLETELCRTR